MKKSFVKTFVAIFMAIILMMLTLTGCIQGEQTEQTEQAEYKEYRAVENAVLGCVELHYEGIVYHPYGGFHNNDFRGKQIGIREADPDSKICEVKSYDIKEWLIEYTDVIMGGGNMLFKAVGVTKIPPELEQYKEYEF